MSSLSFEDLRQEGLRAMRSGSLRAAGEWFERAESAAVSEVERTRALIHQASVAYFLDESSPLFRELPQIVFRRGDPLNVWLSAFYYGNHLVESNQTEAAAKYLQVMLEQVPVLERPAYYSAMTFDFACAIALAERNFRKACDLAVCARNAMALCEPSDEIAVTAALVEHNLGYALLGAGQVAEAIHYLRKSLDALESLSAGIERPRAYLNLAFAYLIQGDVAQCETYLNLLTDCIDSSTDWMRRYLLYLRAEIAQRRGESAQAEDLYAELQQYYPDFPDLSKLLSAVSLLPILVPERY